MGAFRLAFVAMALLGLTACGHDGGSAASAPPGSPAQLAEAAIADGRDAGSFTAVFKAEVMGRPTSGTASVDTRGRCVADLDLADAGTAHLVVSGGTAWVRDDKIFGSGAVPGGAPGKYVTGPATSDMFTSFTFFCDTAARHARLALFAPAQLTDHGTATVNGAKVKVLGTPEGGNVSIAADGRPYVVRVVSGAQEEPYQLTFSDWGKPVDATPPPADQTVPLPPDADPGPGATASPDATDAPGVPFTPDPTFSLGGPLTPGATFPPFGEFPTDPAATLAR